MNDPEARVVITGTDQSGRAIASADSNLKAFARSAMQVRRVLAGFGVVLSGRALASWAKNAVETTDAVGQQAAEVEKAKEAFEAFGKVSDSLAESFAVRVTPSVQLLTMALEELRQTFNPTEAEQLNQQIERTQDEINRLAQGIIKYEQGGFWQRLFPEGSIERSRQQVEELRAELVRLYAERDKRAAGASQPITQEELVALETFIYELNQKPPLITQEELVRLESFIYELNQREPLITQEELVALEEFINELNTVKPNLTQEEWIDLESFIYDLNTMEDESADTAAAIGHNFRDAFADWILGADRSFKDLLKRMAVDMAVSGIFDAFAGMFSGSTGGVGKFFSSFFGGSRASEGPVEAGKFYKVHPGEGFFAPGMDGEVRHLSGGGGVIYNDHSTFTATGGDSREQAAALKSAFAAHKRDVMASIADLILRGRFAN